VQGGQGRVGRATDRPCRRKKPTGGKAAKVQRDDAAKELFEQQGWAKNDVTMEKVISVSVRVTLELRVELRADRADGRGGQGVRMYSFVKEGQFNKGERSEESVLIESGMTFRVSLKEFMYETKKSETMQVFPAELDEIPAFSVTEIMVCPSNTKGFGEGYGFHVGRVRPCDFSLYSMQTALGLSLLPATYEQSVARADAWAEGNAGLRKILECKNTGFFGRAQTGSYIVKYSDGVYRFVGPKTSPGDPESTHLNVMEGGVYAVDIRKEVLLRFTNAVDASEEESLRYACCLLDLASSAGALDFYVVHNEYLLRAVRAARLSSEWAGLTARPAGPQPEPLHRRAPRGHQGPPQVHRRLERDPYVLPAALPRAQHGRAALCAREPQARVAGDGARGGVQGPGAELGRGRGPARLPHHPRRCLRRRDHAPRIHAQARGGADGARPHGLPRVQAGAGVTLNGFTRLLRGSERRTSGPARPRGGPSAALVR